MKQTILALILIVPAFAAPIPRETSSATLERLFGKPDELAKNCQFTLEKQVLRIDVPGDINASAVGLKGAPRTTRFVTGDFVAEVFVSYRVPKEQAGGHCGGGIAVWIDESHYALINRHHWPAGEGKEWSGGFDTHMHAENQGAVSHGATCPNTTAITPGKLKMTRSGSTITSAYSLDNGKTWHDTGKIEVNWPEKIQLGVAAFNTTNKPVVVMFESLDIREGKK